MDNLDDSARQQARIDDPQGQETIEYEVLPFTAENGDCRPVEEWGE